MKNLLILFIISLSFSLTAQKSTLRSSSVFKAVTLGELNQYTGTELKDYIVDAASITFNKFAQNSATTGQVIAWSGSAWAATTYTPADASITYAKIQNVTTNKLLGRATAGSGVMEEITLGTNLSFTGTTLNAAGGGGGSPGGSNTQVQFNNAGAFGGSSSFVWDNTNNRLGIGASPTLASKLHVTGGTLTDLVPGMYFSATMPTVITGTNIAISKAISSAGSSSFVQIAEVISLSSGYTGSSSTETLDCNNATSGTGNSIFGSRNMGALITCTGVTTGTNVGVYGSGTNGNVNYGVFGRAVIAKNSATNIGVTGLSLNTGTSPIQVGGYFGLQNTEPTFASAALMCDNGATTSDIFVARDNGTPVFTIADGGAVTSSNSISSSSGVSAGGALQALASTTYSLIPYRLTNAGGDVYPKLLLGSGANTAGVLRLAYDETNQLLFTAGNGTRHITRASIGITNLTNTAASESGDLIFSTQSSGTAASEKMRITGAGNVGIGMTPTTNFEVKGTIRATQTTNSSTNFSQFVHSDAGGGTGYPRASFVLNGSSVTNAGLYVSCGQATGGTFVPSFLAVSNANVVTYAGSKQLALYQSNSGSYAGILTWTAESTSSIGSDLFFGGASLTGTDAAFWTKTTGKMGVNQSSPTALFEVKGKGTTSSTSSLSILDSSSGINFNIRDDGGFAFKGGTVGLAQTGYTTPTNLTTDRTFNANATTIDELSDVLGTLIEDLKLKGIIKQ